MSSTTWFSEQSWSIAGGAVGVLALSVSGVRLLQLVTNNPPCTQDEIEYGIIKIPDNSPKKWKVRGIKGVGCLVVAGLSILFVRKGVSALTKL